MSKVFPVETWDLFFERLCGGAALKTASAAAGVVSLTGAAWWRKCGLMEPGIQLGGRGGLAGRPPAAVPGPPRPAERPHQRRPLSSEDRAVIAAGLRQRLSFAQIGALVGRDKSVVCREAARNRGRDGSYFPAVAHRAAHERRRRPKPFKLVDNPRLCAQIETWMDQGWSPKLIAAVLRQDPSAATMGRVSHETIYQALYVQARGELRKDLYRQLSLKRPQRVARDRADGRGVRYQEAWACQNFCVRA